MESSAELNSEQCKYKGQFSYHRLIHTTHNLNTLIVCVANDHFLIAIKNASNGGIGSTGHDSIDSSN